MGKKESEGAQSEQANSLKQQSMRDKIDETEMRYMRDSQGYNSFPNPLVLSKDDESSSYLYVPFPA